MRQEVPQKFSTGYNGTNAPDFLTGPESCVVIVCSDWLQTAQQGSPSFERTNCQPVSALRSYVEGDNSPVALQAMAPSRAPSCISKPAIMQLLACLLLLQGVAASRLLLSGQQPELTDLDQPVSTQTLGSVLTVEHITEQAAAVDEDAVAVEDVSAYTDQSALASAQATAIK